MAEDRLLEVVERVCPYCGSRVLFIDESQEIMHVVPICNGFMELMRDFGLNHQLFLVHPAQSVRDQKNLPS